MHAWKLVTRSDITWKNQECIRTPQCTYANHDVGKHTLSLFKRLVLFFLICLFLSPARSTIAYRKGRAFNAGGDGGSGSSRRRPLGAFGTSFIASDTSHRPFVGRGAPRGAPLAYSGRPSQETEEEEGDSDPAEAHQTSTHAKYRREELPVDPDFALEDWETNSAGSAVRRRPQEMRSTLSSRASLILNAKRKEFLDAMKMAKEAAEHRGFLRRLIGRVTDDQLTVDALAMAELAKKLHDWNMQNQQNPGKTKLIVAMRHAESTFNVWRRESFSKLRFHGKAKRVLVVARRCHHGPLVQLVCLLGLLSGRYLLHGRCFWC